MRLILALKNHIMASYEYMNVGGTLQWFLRTDFNLPVVRVLGRTNLSLSLSLSGFGLSLSKSRGFITSSKMSNIQEIKEKYLNLSLDEKREFYKCKNDFVTLKSIVPWSKYYFEEGIEYNNNRGTQNYNMDSSINDRVALWQGDITKLEIDAIVNAANNSLLGGGGVDGAIHSSAGGELRQECEFLNGCDTGKAKMTGGYKLPSKYIIHTVGPRGEKPDLLKSCYTECLNLVTENNLKSVALPCISTGIYGYPPTNAAIVALKTVRDFLENQKEVKMVIFCVFLNDDLKIYQNLMQIYFPCD